MEPAKKRLAGKGTWKTPPSGAVVGSTVQAEAAAVLAVADTALGSAPAAYAPPPVAPHRSPHTVAVAGMGEGLDALSLGETPSVPTGYIPGRAYPQSGRLKRSRHPTPPTPSSAGWPLLPTPPDSIFQGLTPPSLEGLGTGFAGFDPLGVSPNLASLSTILNSRDFPTDETVRAMGARVMTPPVAFTGSGDRGLAEAEAATASLTGTLKRLSSGSLASLGKSPPTSRSSPLSKSGSTPHMQQVLGHPVQVTRSRSGMTHESGLPSHPSSGSLSSRGSKRSFSQSCPDLAGLEMGSPHLASAMRNPSQQRKAQRVSPNRSPRQSPTLQPQPEMYATITPFATSAGPPVLQSFELGQVRPASHAAPREVKDKKAEKLARSRASARLRRERKRLQADSLSTQTKILEAAIEAVKAHRWTYSDCKHLFRCLDDADTAAVRAMAPANPVEVQKIAAKLIQEHSAAVTHIWHDMQACELLMKAAMYSRAMHQGSTKPTTPLVAEVLGVLQLKPEQAQQLAANSSQLACLKRQMRRVDKVLAGLIERSRQCIESPDHPRSRRWMKFDVLGTMIRPFKDVWTPKLRMELLKWSSENQGMIEGLPLLSMGSAPVSL